MSPTPAHKNEPEQMPWDEALGEFEKLNLATKSIHFEFGKKRLTFRIRALSQAEHDEIAEGAADAKATQKQFRRGAAASSTIPLDMTVLTRGLIRAGVKEGPPGWKPTDANIDALPREIRNALVDAIEHFLTMPEDDFRRLG